MEVNKAPWMCRHKEVQMRESRAKQKMAQCEERSQPKATPIHFLHRCWRLCPQPISRYCLTYWAIQHFVSMLCHRLIICFIIICLIHLLHALKLKLWYDAFSLFLMKPKNEESYLLAIMHLISWHMSRSARVLQNKVSKITGVHHKIDIRFESWYNPG